MDSPPLGIHITANALRLARLLRAGVHDDRQLRAESGLHRNSYREALASLASLGAIHYSEYVSGQPSTTRRIVIVNGEGPLWSVIGDALSGEVG